MQHSHVCISQQKLEPQNCINFVSEENCGAINLFIGTVRNQTKKKAVQKLHFTCYKSMAIKEMQKIAQLALSRFEIHKIAIQHFEGTLVLGEIAVVIAVSAAHRAASFEACKFAIDSIKDTVPIWKKEYFEDGCVWVNATP